MIRAMLAAISTLSFLAIVPAADERSDWSKFAKWGTLKGVVVSADDGKITLQIPALKKRENPAGNPGRPGMNRRPGGKIGLEDVDISYAPGGLVRWEKVPTKPDGSKPTIKDLEELRKPAGAPGFAASRGDLKAGHIVELTLVRPSSVAADKVKESDIVIKYAIIEGETAAPKKDDPKKKKN